jgi:hypothetical protein
LRKAQNREPKEAWVTLDGSGDSGEQLRMFDVVL